MDQFISEPIEGLAGSFDSGAMARGLPGLPRGFRWREQTYAVVEVLDAWKQSAPEGGRPGGERYLRRHCYRLRMSDGGVWTVYLVRQTPPGGSAKRRWFLYSRTAGPA